jgi:hypothetical protein
MSSLKKIISRLVVEVKNKKYAFVPPTVEVKNKKYVSISTK